MALTPAQRQDVEKAEVELDRQVGLAERWLKEKTGGLTGEYLLNDAERAAVKNAREEIVRAGTWRSTWRQWAEAAWHPDGYVYRFDHYLQVGRDIAGALAFHTKQGFNASAFNLAAVAVEEKATAAAEVVQKGFDKLEDAADALAKPWPWWVKGLLGIAGLAVAAGAARGLVK